MRSSILIILMLLINPKGFNLFAQVPAGELTDIKAFEGYFQHQENRDMYLQIKASGDTITLLQNWDGREVRFDRKGDMDFHNASLKSPLTFAKDSIGRISTLTAFKRDVWMRASGHAPQVLNKLKQSGKGVTFKNQSSLTDSITLIMSQLKGYDLFSGTVLIAHGKQVIFQYACGDAIKERGIPNSINTKFNLGSMNKMFTSVAAMQLSEQRKLNLSDPISKYLDSTWLPLALSRRIQIRHLMSHTSGLGDFFGPHFSSAPRRDFKKLNAFKRFLNIETLAFEPGTKWKYSNTGMLLLGAIIEKVSGEDYFEYVRRHIYEKANMKVAGAYDVNDGVSDIAVGYIPKPDGKYDNNMQSIFTIASPAGGGYANADDLHKFFLALTSEKLISHPSLALITSVQNSQPYGYGFQIWDSGKRKIFGHSGGADGINAVQYMLPAENWTIIVLSNYQGSAHSLGEYLLSQVLSYIDTPK